MSITCITEHTPQLEGKYKKLVDSGLSEKDAAIKVAIEEHKALFDELNKFKASIGIKLTKDDKTYVSPEIVKPIEVKDVQEDALKDVESDFDYSDFSKDENFKEIGKLSQKLETVKVPSEELFGRVYVENTKNNPNSLDESSRVIYERLKKGEKSSIVPVAWYHKNKIAKRSDDSIYNRIFGSNYLKALVALGEDYLPIKILKDDLITENKERVQEVKVANTAKELEDKIPFERKRQEAINTIPTEKINYKNIKGIGDLSIYLNNPNSLKNSNLKSAFELYKKLKNGDTIKDKPYLTTNNELLDGQNRIAAQLALGNENIDVVKVDKNFFDIPETTQISEAYHKAKKDATNPELVKAVEDLLGNKTNEKAKTEEVKRPIETPRVAERKGEVESAIQKFEEAKAKLNEFKNKFGIFKDPKEEAKVNFEYHKALVGVAKAYIKEGIDNVKDFAKEIGEKVSDAIENAWKEASGGKELKLDDFMPTKASDEKEVSGIKKALVSDEIIESVNLDKISDKQMLELGKKLVETGEIKPENITLSIAKGTPRSLQPKEVVALIYYKATLDNKRRELLSEYNNKLEQGESIADVALELDKVQTDIDLYDVMAVITANQQSLAFRLRKGLLDKDYNLVTQIEQYKKVNGGVIPAEIEKRFRELDKQLTELKDKLKEAEQRAIEAEEKQSIKNIEEDVKRSNSAKNRASLTPQEKARKRELAKKYNVFNDVTRILTIVAEKDFREYAGLILKEAKGDFVEFGRELIKTVGNDIKDFLPNLYKQLGGKGEANISDLIQKPFVKDGVLVIPPAYIRDSVENGITDIDALAEAVKKEVEVDLPNVTIRAVRDAITQYGRTVNQTKDTIQRQINEAKRLGRLYSELEDLQDKKKKERSGKVYNKISDKERELKRKIKILEKDIPPTAEEVEQTEEQRSNLRKQYLKKYIQEKKERLETGNFAPNPKPLPVRKDSEIIALETEANKIRDEYDAAHYDNEQANRSVGKKFLDGLKEWGTGVSRALVAGLDFGFFLVQGLISVTSSNPLKTGYAVKQSFLSGLGTDVNPITETRKFFRELGSERIERELLANLKAQPYYPIIKASKLAIQEPNAKLGERDDALQASVINKIWNFVVSPLKFVNPSTYETAVRINPYRAAERAYTGASNAIRVQMFLDFAQALENKGITYEQSPELYRIAANTANNMTFRGRLRTAEPIAAELNMLFFSARKVTASLSLVNPAYWADVIRTNPIVAKQALLKMATFIGVTTSITLALQAFSDDEEEEQNPDMFNPYSSDFMTYRIGNTRLNFYGGLGSNVVLLARFITGNYKTTSSSKVKTLGQDSFTPNRKELVETTLFANKLNPMAGVGYAYLNQSIGREIDWESEAVSSVTPLWAQNISELRREHPETMAAFLSYMSFLGQSINTYGTPEFIDRKKDKELFDLIQLKNASFSEKKRADVDVVDINTGELREITKDEFETFKKEYGNYVKNYLKSNYNELFKMPVEKFEKEITNLKTRATKVAKEKIVGFNTDLMDIEIDNQDYKLNLNQIKERQEFINDFKNKKGSKIIDRQISNGKSEYEASKILESQARKDATDKMKKIYKDGEGLQRK